MKTSTQKRIARPSGLLLLALLVVALAVPAAQAFPSQRSTLVQLAQAHRDRDLQPVAVSGTSNAAQSQTWVGLGLLLLRRRSGRASRGGRAA